MKHNKNSGGFTVVELLLTFIVIILIGFVGYYVYHAQKTANKTTPDTAKTTTTSSTKPKAADPYAGWKSGTMKYEQASFKYPSDWTLGDNSGTSTGRKGPCGNPGFDQITLTAPSHAAVTLMSAAVCGGGAGLGNPLNAASIPISTLGRDAYILFLTDGNPDLSSDATKACVVQSTEGTQIASKHVTSPNTNEPVGITLCYYPDVNSEGSTFVAVSTMQSSADFARAKLIFQSLTY